MSKDNLIRFIDAQKGSYTNALSEIKQGKKQTHWMWYIFPQVQGLGSSSTAKYYAIEDLAEAVAYLEHEVLGMRLREACHALLSLEASDPYKVFGSPDDLKLRSSMTLFSQIESGDPIFNKVLEKFFGGAKDERTLKLLGRY